MKNRQENLATLTIRSRNVTIFTREPKTCAWISVNIWRQDGAICSKNRKNCPISWVRAHPKTYGLRHYGSWFYKTRIPCPRPWLPPSVYGKQERAQNFIIFYFFCGALWSLRISPIPVACSISSSTNLSPSLNINRTKVWNSDTWSSFFSYNFTEKSLPFQNSWRQ